MSTNHPPDEMSGSLSDDWELVNQGSSSDDASSLSSSSCDFVRLQDTSASYHHRLESQNDVESDARSETTDSTDGGVTSAAETPELEPGLEGAAGGRDDTCALSAPLASMAEKSEKAAPSPVNDVAESVEVINDGRNEEDSDDGRSPERVEEVYAELRERLSARMSRESSSESDASDFIRLDRVGPVQRVAGSGSSVSSRFSFIQRSDRDEDESLPESDISLLSEESAQNDSVMALGPTDHPHYRHRPNPDLNFWLNVLVGVVVALAVGLGIGHAIGSSREIRNQRDIQLGQVDQIKSLQNQLTQCWNSAEQNRHKISTEQNDAVVYGLRLRIQHLGWRYDELSSKLEQKSAQVNSLDLEKENLLHELATLKMKMGENQDKIGKISEQTTVRSDHLSAELDDARSRIDLLESENSRLESDVSSSGLVVMRQELNDLRQENDRLKDEVGRLREDANGELRTRMAEIERRNVELEKRCDLVTSQQDPSIREELRKLRIELETERSVTQMFRALLNTTSHLPGEIKSVVLSLSNSSLVQNMWQTALNSTQNLDQVPELALNGSQEILDFLAMAMEKVQNKTREELPTYIDKTKKTVSVISKQIQETWSKLKDLKIDDETMKNKAQKFRDSVKDFGRGIVENVKRFADKFKNKFSERKENKERHKKKDHGKPRKDRNNNYKRKSSDYKFEHKEKPDKRQSRDENRKDKMNGKFAHIKQKIKRLNEKSWTKMDLDDVEDIFEDLVDLFNYYRKSGLMDARLWLDCQKHWFESEYRGDRKKIGNCGGHLFEWQLNVSNEDRFRKRNSTSEWYFRAKERDGDPDWYFKRAESREDSHHDPNWQFDRAKQREKDRKVEIRKGKRSGRSNKFHRNFDDFKYRENVVHNDKFNDWDWTDEF